MLLLFFVTLFIGCNAQKNEFCLVNLEKNLEPKLNKKIEQLQVINIKDSIKCINWDSLLVESGYGNKESIKKYYNIDIPDYYQNSNLGSESVLFFLKDNIVVNYIKINNSCKKNEVCKTYDFLPLIKYNKNAIILRKDAIFEVYTRKVSDNLGNSWTQENAMRIKS